MKDARSRTSDVYDIIRQDIICGRHAPGGRLKIETIRKEYDCGATPVREALSLLTADGLVARVDQRGFRVAEVSVIEFDELLAIRCFAESRALRLAMERGGTEWEEQIVLARHRLLSRPAWGEDGPINPDWESHHQAFHMALISACGSRTLKRLCRQLYDENLRYRHIARLKASFRSAEREHQMLADVILARDADRAVDMLVEHYRRTGKLLRKALSASNGETKTTGQAAAVAGAGHADTDARFAAAT